MGLREKIKKLKRSYSVEDIASFVGVSWKTIYRWEDRENKHHKIFEKKIDEMLNLSNKKEITNDK